MIKGIFKLIFGLLLTVIVLVGSVLAFVYFSIRDKTNEIPYELYSEDITFEDEVNNILFSSLDQFSENTELDVSFSEDNLNKLIFAIIRQNYPNYLPTDDCDEFSCQVIAGTKIDLPVIGKRAVAVKGAYGKFVNQDIRFYVILDLGSIPSTINLTLSFQENDGVYKLIIKRLSLGKLNILSGLGKIFLGPVLNAVGLSEEKINQVFEQKNIPLTFNQKELSFNFDKENLSEVIKKLLTPKDSTPSEENEMLMSLLDIFASNDLINFGFFDKNENKHFGIRLTLEKLSVKEERRSLPHNVQTPFNTEVFINNKTQSFILSNLVSEPKLTFTNLDFNRIIYDKTNQYQDFKYEFTLPNGKTFKISIDGILINFTKEEVVIDIIINMNDLITIMKIKSEVIDNNTNNVKLKIFELITLGEDEDEQVGEYISTSNLYLLNLLGDYLSELDIIKYDKTQHTFIIDSETFNSLINVTGTNDTPLISVDAINILNGYLDISITYQDPHLQDIINNVTTLINDLLTNHSVSMDDFDLTNPEQMEIVEGLIDTLDNISNTLSNNEELTPEQIDTLIDLINKLDDDNLDTFTNIVEQEISDDTLLELYDLLFGQVK